MTTWGQRSFPYKEQSITFISEIWLDWVTILVSAEKQLPSFTRLAPQFAAAMFQGDTPANFPTQYSPKLALLLIRRLSSSPLFSQEHGLHFWVGGLLCQKEAGRRWQPRSEHRRVPAAWRHCHHLPGSSGGAEPPGNAGGHGTRGEWYEFGKKLEILSFRCPWTRQKWSSSFWLQ